MTRIRGAALAAVTLLGQAWVAAPAADAAGSGARGAEHVTVAEEYDGTEHSAAGDLVCVPWAGTLHEVRHGSYEIVLPPGGQVLGEAHLNGAVEGLVEIVPDDPVYPTYSGSYREKVVGVFLGIDDEGDDVLRTARYGLVSRLQGSDGSSLRLTLSGKLTMDAHGRLVVDRSVQSCD